MTDDTVTLRAIYREGAALDGNPPDHVGGRPRPWPYSRKGARCRYRVEARGGALTADCPDFQTALAYFTRWAEGEV